MKLIIDISEEDYIRLRDEGMFGNVTTFKRAVREGIPLDQEPCDAVSRKEVMNMLHNHAFDYATSTKILALLKTMCGEVDRMPSVIPQYTEAEIQRMQELEQAEIQKAYELGKAEGSSEKPNKWIPAEVLDKIRTEIADLDDADYDYEGYYKAVTDAVKIIDKYKASPTGAERSKK